MNGNHVVIVKKIEEVNGLWKRTFERQPTKKRLNVSSNVISKFFSCCQQSFLKVWWTIKIFLAKPWPFIYEKSIVIAICGKCLV